MTKQGIRVGDSVLVRCEVFGMTQGSTHLCHPGVGLPGNSLVSVDKVDIVSVEQKFRLGDNVQFKDSADYGKIVALSPDGVEPKQAWVQVVGKWPLATRDLRSLTRLETK